MTGKDHEKETAREQAHASHGARGLQAALEKAGVPVLGVVEAPDGGAITLSLAVGLEVKDFSFATDDATPDAVLAAFLAAGGKPAVKDPPAEAE